MHSPTMHNNNKPAQQQLQQQMTTTTMTTTTAISLSKQTSFANEFKRLRKPYLMRLYYVCITGAACIICIYQHWTLSKTDRTHLSAFSKAYSLCSRCLCLAAANSSISIWKACKRNFAHSDSRMLKLVLHSEHGSIN